MDSLSKVDDPGLKSFDEKKTVLQNVGGLLKKSERSQPETLRVNWTVLLKRSPILNGSAGKWTIQKLKVNCPKDEG